MGGGRGGHFACKLFKSVGHQGAGKITLETLSNCIDYLILRVSPSGLGL